MEQAWVHDLEVGGERVSQNVSVVQDDHSLTFEFDIAGLGTLSESSWGVHFTPSCGNDVVEGGTPVPEPATALLLIGGLAGLGMIKMRKKAS